MYCPVHSSVRELKEEERKKKEAVRITFSHSVSTKGL